MLERSIRAADYVNFHLGGHALRAKLNHKGWSNEQIKNEHLALIEAREPVIRFMGGEGVYDMLPPQFRESMLALSALRMLVEEVGA